MSKFRRVETDDEGYEYVLRGTCARRANAVAEGKPRRTMRGRVKDGLWDRVEEALFKPFMRRRERRAGKEAMRREAERGEQE